ncbi:MAG: hypothetical protein HQK89_14400 [Nitrospirae bacterium]|nr:hypothetical protein [Nitrospirota bacterium]
MGQYGKAGLSLVLKESIRSFYKNNFVFSSIIGYNKKPYITDMKNT